MAYIGDFALGSTFDTKFCTVGTTGAPATLSGSPVISAYVDNSDAEITAGITLSVDFDGRTGLNNIRVVATSGNGFAAGSNYQLVITVGTVGGTSVVGYVVAEFSIEARSALRPTTPGNTLGVAADGDISGNIDGAVASVSGDVGGNVVGSVASVTGAVGSVAGNVDGNVIGSVGSLAAQAKADVNGEVLDVLNADTFAEPGQEAPPTPTTLVTKIGYLYKFLRNRVTSSGSEIKVYNDAGATVDQKATHSDDGSTYDRAEFGVGP